MMCYYLNVHFQGERINTQRSQLTVFCKHCIQAASLSCSLSVRERDKSKALHSEHLPCVCYQKPRTIKQQPKRSGAFARFTVMRRRTTFWSTTDRIYDGGSIR